MFAFHDRIWNPFFELHNVHLKCFWAHLVFGSIKIAVFIPLNKPLSETKLKIDRKIEKLDICRLRNINIVFPRLWASG